ncbi:MAG: septum formation initiator family protein [Pyrinomonadaceae bacterium]|nr:septum formation initiator family protein [Pyrinomonadaceae bacterium]
MNKVAVTYWDNPRTISMPVNRSAKTAKAQAKTSPQWFMFAVISAMTLMLCMAINLRAFSEMSAEVEQNERLSLTVEQLTDENIGLQTEVHSLKTDKMTVEREARKIGMSRPNEKVLVPVN